MSHLNQRRIPAIYLAGRIKTSESRERFGVVDYSLFEYQPIPIAPIKRVSILGYEFDYTGPWTVGDDHSSSHVRAGTKPYGEKNTSLSIGAYGFGVGTVSHGAARIPAYSESDCSLAFHHATFQRSCDGIDKADIVFAWIEDHECYGTLAEIGYAKAKGKIVCIAHPPTIDPSGEMWFAFISADFEVIASTAKEALQAFIKGEGSKLYVKISHPRHYVTESEVA